MSEHDHDRARVTSSESSNDAAREVAAPASPSSLIRWKVQRRAVQRRVIETPRLGDEPSQVAAAAERGTAGAAGPLPHLDTIQRSFGRHDVSHVRAHDDTNAHAGAAAMGAQAFATGDHVAFGATPDLHLAAHEAAHVVQQRAGVHLKGGVGEAGDDHERHADAVADRVVRGESSEALLDRYAGGAAPQGPVQRRQIAVSATLRAKLATLGAQIDTDTMSHDALMALYAQLTTLSENPGGASATENEQIQVAISSVTEPLLEAIMNNETLEARAQAPAAAPALGAGGHGGAATPSGPSPSAPAPAPSKAPPKQPGAPSLAPPVMSSLPSTAATPYGSGMPHPGYAPMGMGAGAPSPYGMPHPGYAPTGMAAAAPSPYGMMMPPMMPGYGPPPHAAPSPMAPGKGSAAAHDSGGAAAAASDSGGTISRGKESDVTLHKPLGSATLPLAQIAGTHLSVANTFSDGQPVQKMIDQLVANPSLVTTTDTFVLTVFCATRPGDPKGAAHVWSMNNRRLKAMQEADAILRQKGGALPPIRVKWATADELKHAVRPGAFNNMARTTVAFHNLNTRTARLGNTSRIDQGGGAAVAATAASIEGSLDDSEALAKLLGF